MKLTIPELYLLSEVDKYLYNVINKYNIPVSSLKKTGLTMEQAKRIDEYLGHKIKQSPNLAKNWKLNSFWSFAEKFAKDENKRKQPQLKKPFYDIMFDHYRSLRSWSDELEAKRNRLVTYLYKGFPRKEHRAKVDTPQNRDYIEYIVNNHSTTGPSGRSVFAVFEDRIQALINDGVFTEDFLKHLAVKDEMLLWHVLDYMYPPSHDKGGPYHVVRGAK